MIVIILVLVFAISHSLMADQRTKQAFRNRFGERAYFGLYRLIYNIVAILTLAPVILYVYLKTGRVVWILPYALEPILYIIQAIGILGAAISLFQINLGRFVGLSQLRAYVQHEPLPLPQEPLTTNGLYAFMRHPLYLFSLMTIWPVAVMTELWLAFSIAATLYFVFGSLWEERRMVDAFGQTYRDYQKRVPWFLPIPRFRKRSPSNV